MAVPERKHPARQPVFDIGSRANILFVTVCTEGRKPILANNDIHRLLVQCWLKADHWLVGRYMIMPDHIHFFCSPARLDHVRVKRWVQYWKSLASLEWPSPAQQPIWQLDAWDRQLRSGESYSEKW
ncbi:transposase [Cerasicoccus maritimus]|uniref:transposase n=1 Tax=Cerasicoccus maritimus TaxID=490089 RepID=UPI002852DA90|nr:transposase [Cerasicoccus maritimus]